MTEQDGAPSNRFKVVVCASGGGGNFQALIDARESLEINIILLVVDRACGAVGRAIEHGIPWINLATNRGSDRFFNSFDQAIPAETNLIVLAGFMPIIPPFLCQKWQGKMINTHPSLLPKYGGKGMYGVRVQEAVMRAGDKTAGCTIHYVTEQVDKGTIILQKTIAVDDTETPWQLGGRIFLEENKLLVDAVRHIKSVGT